MLLVLLLCLGTAASATIHAEAQALRSAASDHTAYTLPPQKLLQAQALTRIREILYFAGTAWSILQLVLLLAANIPSRLRALSESITQSRWLQCLLFVFLFLLTLTLLNLPLRIYGHHVGLSYGLSVQHWLSWSLDQAKSFLLSWIVATLLVMTLFWIIRRSPRRWWLWFWLPTMGAVLFGVLLEPVLVDPWFNRFEPLTSHDAALATKLEQVALHSGVDIPVSRMFLMHASDKVTSLNAYVTGVGPSKRLVLWDTTIAASPSDELGALFGHELGHYALHHIALGLCLTAVSLFAGFWVAYRLALWLLARYGLRWGIRDQQDWAFLAILLLVLQLLSFASSPLVNASSRSMEHAADVYGQEAIHGIVSDPQTVTMQSFQRMGEASLDDPTPHPFLDFWTGSHPSIAERAAFARAYNPWTPGEHPKYFETNR